MVVRGHMRVQTIRLSHVVSAMLAVVLFATFPDSAAGAPDPPLPFECPPPGAASMPVPGKVGEEGWLIGKPEVDDLGNIIELWCLKANDKHNGPDFGWLFGKQKPRT